MDIEDAILAKTTLFYGVNLSDVKPLIAQCVTKSLPVGKFLLRPDTQSDNMYVVLKGQVSIHLELESNEPIAYVNEGECVGELSIFDGQNPSAYVKAVVSTDVLVISSDILWQIVEQSHPVSCNLLRLLAQRVRRGNEAVNTSKILQQQSERDANIDPLTGLFNRRWLNTYFDRILAGEAQRPDLAMLLVDVDYFKNFNDEFGHHAGDVALRALSSALQQNIRPDDIAARVGGEEFVLVFPSTDIGDAKAVAERVRASVEAVSLNYEGRTLPQITISIGIAMMRSQDSFVDLFAAADGALYCAKDSGRNRICVASRALESSDSGIM